MNSGILSTTGETQDKMSTQEVAAFMLESGGHYIMPSTLRQGCQKNWASHWLMRLETYIT